MTEAHADRKGIWLPEIDAESCAAVFDGRVIWRFDAPTRADGFVAWPAVLRPWLEGRSHLVIEAGKERIDLGEVAFGDSEARIEFVDPYGIPILVDKWGLAQRAFEVRQEGVLDFLVGEAERLVEVVSEQCGIDLWMAFGTLLGAMRSGEAIGHDSDVDLAYLSSAATPAEMQVELFAMRRALAAAGYRVVTKSGSFLTVILEAPDGAPVTIDIYTCFYVGDVFYATATLRTELPVEAVLPLGRLPFHGRMLPAPADPDRVLAASYGPGWREPDPSFRHAPGRRLALHFEEWFGHYMRQRRDWELYWREHTRTGSRDDHGFRDWVRADLAPESTVLDIGAGDGEDALAFAREGHQVWALEYARDATDGIRADMKREHLRIHLGMLNLHDTRNAVTMGAMIAGSTGPHRAVYLRHTLDALPASSRENLWLLASMALRRSGRLYAEYDEVPADPSGEFRRFHGSGGRQWEVTRGQLRAEWRRFGAREILRVPVPSDPGRRRWRMVLSWT
jgi:hypothetical protein